MRQNKVRPDWQRLKAKEERGEDSPSYSPFHGRARTNRWLRANACDCALLAHWPRGRLRHPPAPALWLDLPASQCIRFERAAEEQRRPASGPGEERSGESFGTPSLQQQSVSAKTGCCRGASPSAITSRIHGKMCYVAMPQKGYLRDNCRVSHSLHAPARIACFTALAGGQSCCEWRRRRLSGGNRDRMGANAGGGSAACDGGLARR